MINHDYQTPRKLCIKNSTSTKIVQRSLQQKRQQEEEPRVWTSRRQKECLTITIVFIFYCSMCISRVGEFGNRQQITVLSFPHFVLTQ